MTEPHRLIAFPATAFVVIIIPGPSVLFVITRGVTPGRHARGYVERGNRSTCSLM